MTDKPTYSMNQIKHLIAEMSDLFDVVRLVDPISMTTYTVEDGQFIAQGDSCFHVWNKTDRCENCVSARCLMQNERFSKFEFIDKSIYYVVAQPVQVEDNRLVLEVVTASHDNVLLSAYGNNEFVDRITTFNHKIYTDALTGLANRRFLDERFDILLERSTYDDSTLSVVMIDVDDFKNINDGMGHLVGDSALCLASNMIRKALKPGSEDILVRYGGDEFIAVMQDLTRDELERRLCAIEPIDIEGAFTVTFSIGALFLTDLRDVEKEELIKLADRTMYRVKASGKNSFAIVE